MGGTGVERVHELRERHGGKRHGRPKLRAAGLPTERVGDQRQCADHRALPHGGETETVSKHTFALRARRALHDIRVAGLQPERHRRQTVGDEVDPQKLDRKQGGFFPKEHCKQHHQNLAEVAGEQEVHRFADVIVNAPAAANRGDHGGEVIVGQYHVRRTLGDVGAGLTHRAPDVRRFERRGVVDAVAGHGDDLALALPRLDDAKFIGRGYPGGCFCRAPRRKARSVPRRRSPDPRCRGCRASARSRRR